MPAAVVIDLRYLLALLLVAAGCAGPAASSTDRGAQVDTGVFVVATPPVRAGGCGLVCPEWTPEVHSTVDLVFRRHVAPYRWGFIEIRVEPLGDAKGREEDLVARFFTDVESRLRAGHDFTRRGPPLAGEFPLVSVARDAVTVDGRRLHRLSWKSQKRDLTLIPSFTVLEGMIYVVTSLDREPREAYIFFILERHPSGHEASRLVEQIEPVVRSFRRK